MLVLTGIMLGVVLLVMVGEQAQEMQLAHWLPTTQIPWLASVIPAPNLFALRNSNVNIVRQNAIRDADWLDPISGQLSQKLRFVKSVLCRMVEKRAIDPSVQSGAGYFFKTFRLLPRTGEAVLIGAATLTAFWSVSSLLVSHRL
jgi:hypothetical protein